MTPVFCQFEENKALGSVGDCYRACIASLLDLPWHEVPHFVAQYEADWLHGMSVVDEWLAARGMTMFRFVMTAPTFEGLLDGVSLGNPGKAVILIGASGRKPCDHAVVVCDGRILHDPSPLSGISGPCIGRDWYQVEVLGSAQLVLSKRGGLPVLVQGGMHRGSYLIDENDQLVEAKP